MVRLIALLTLALQAAVPQQHAILAVGDSMTAGYGVAPEDSYPAQLELELKSRGLDYRVVNQGVTGSTTTQAVGRMTRALAVQAEIVIIQLRNERRTSVAVIDRLHLVRIQPTFLRQL